MALISVIVSTYNRPKALKLVLEGYARSRFRDFEVVVADDGSTEETEELIRSFAGSAPYSLQHVRQQDDGFRLAAVRNLAVRAARGTILFFTDGDCIPFPNCLCTHAESCVPGRAVAGGRCALEPHDSDQLLSGTGSPETTLGQACAREGPRLRRLRLKNWFYSRTHLKPRPKLQTANASIHRRDFEEVNGFDERFVGWGYEDEDLARRLRRRDVTVLDATVTSLVAHLFHTVHESHRPDARANPNYRYFQKGRFLTRPLRGLERRGPHSLSLELLGNVPAALRPLSGSVPSGDPEVSIVFGRSSLSRKCCGRGPRGEVILRARRDEETPSAQAFYRFLERSL